MSLMPSMTIWCPLSASVNDAIPLVSLTANTKPDENSARYLGQDDPRHSQSECSVRPGRH